MTEICQNMSPTELIKTSHEDGTITVKIKSGDYVVCNLSSLNLGRSKTPKEIEETVTAQMRMMDNVIDLNYYPVPQAEITNQNWRPIGLGTSGYHQWLVENKIMWESEAHLEAADDLYEFINYCAIKASMELAKEKGSYLKCQGSEWQTGAYFESRGYLSGKREGKYVTTQMWIDLSSDCNTYGVRNGWMFAIAPTASTSLIAGSTAMTDPIFSKFWVEERKNLVIPQTAPNLNESNFFFYKEAHHIDQHWSIKAAGRRQRHIDQSGSFNLYITPDYTAKEFMDLYMAAWENGLKTVYYCRNKSLEIDDCVSCSS